VHGLGPGGVTGRMTRICKVRDCGAPAASRYSPHCRRHKSVLRRQGDPDQSAIRVTELAPFVRLVRLRVARNPDSPLWGHLEDRWRGIAEEARAVAFSALRSRHERAAAAEVMNIDADCSAQEIVVVVLAMFILWRERPARFRSDRAFRLQLARRVRALSGRHSGLRYDHQTGTQKRVYREMTPKAGAILGHKLALAFGGAGLQLAMLEERERERARQTVEDINQAIKELK
jgi:hypothetical protein